MSPSVSRPTLDVEGRQGPGQLFLEGRDKAIVVHEGGTQVSYELVGLFNGVAHQSTGLGQVFVDRLGGHVVG
jgi:hypothetical protein